MCTYFSKITFIFSAVFLDSWCVCVCKDKCRIFKSMKYTRENFLFLVE